ncbi:MAG: right-handed parallel beta-helix repeat-containing protein, partial [Saprospiraceae bacterium]|nr:right-handed parallel beta-helix repeat-containing protein [Saprospiraceae bacterium]
MITKTLRFILTILALVIISGINAQTIITIGTGTTTNSTSSYPAPYGNYYWGAKHQFIIPASELIAAGGLAGNINSLAFDVATVKGVALSGFTIKIGTTTQSALSGTFISGLSQVYSVTSYTETAGWNTHNFSSPFSWDGTSNLIIETCFNNSSWTDNAIIRNTPTTYISTIAYNNDDQSVCSFTSGSTYYVRPNIKLGISPPVSNDLGISSWESPKDGCSLSSSEHITIKVKNYGTSSQNNYTLKYSIDGGTTWTSQALTTSISPGNTLTHTFTTTANFSAIGQYTCLANVVLAGDPNSWNDTFGPIIITNNNSNPLPYNEDFESFTDGQLTNLPNGWTISPVSVPYWLPKNASGGYNYSPPAYDHTKKGEAGGMFLNFNDYYGTSGDSSFFTSPCLDLAGGSSPKIRFWYTSYGFDTQNLILQENINGIWFGVSWNNSGRYNNYSSNTWTEAFASLSSNAQKIRFKAIKSSSDNSLGIDDITIYQAFNNDLMVSEWIEPINGSSLGTGKDIKIEIYNYGLSTQSNIPVYYTINGGTTIVGPEIIPGPLSPNAALQYTFTNKANLTTSGIYKGGAVVALATDQNKSNDTLMQDFIACGGLSGTYTIKPNGTGDFKNFTDAIEFLDYCGVSGPVVFNVDPGTYTEQLTFEYYTGISATNNILFQSTSPDSTQTVITYNINDNNNNYIIHFNNAKHITFKGFNIMPDQNSSYNTCIRFYQADSNAVIGNQIVTNINNNPIITTYTYSNSNYNKIIGNFIYGGSNSIELYATSSSYREYGNIIEGNTITNFNQNAIKCYYQDHIQIKENFINTGESQNMLYGIYIYKSEFPSITKNKIFIESTYSNYGIYLSTCSGGSGDTAQIVNNFISLNSGTGSSNYGIYLSSSNFYHIYNNSSHIYGNQPLSSSFYDYSSGQVYVLNNNFANTAGGKAYYTNYSTNIPVTNYNNLYSSGIYIGYWGSNITNLSAWKTATNRSPNSISVHPGFNSNNDLHTTAISLNGSGTPIPTVTDDIDGDTRNIITPDIGADEFSPSSNDLAITEIIAPISGTAPSSSVQVIIQVVNKGLSGQGNFPVKYSINGGSTYITQTIYQTIMPGDTLNHTFTTTANMSTFGNYPIIALVDLTTDQNRSNDTIAKDIFACNAMSGTYQIGGTSSDFASFSQAVNALMSCGVSGAVTINIAPGTYNEQVNIDNISGTYASNTVTFKSLNDDSSSVILQYAPIESNKNFVVQFNHCHHISFKQITIKNLSSSYGHVVVFTDSAYLNSIENNHLEGLVTTSSSDDFAIIYNPKNSTEHMQTIKNNRIMNGSFGISLYGISDGYSPIDEISNIIEGNKIMNFNYAGIEISNQDSPHAISNYIESGTSGSEIGGIILEYSNYAQRIQKNHIIINGTSNKAGIILNYCAGDGSGGQIVAGNPSTDYGLISNNFICIPT